MKCLCYMPVFFCYKVAKFIHIVPATVVFHTEIFDMCEVTRESRRTCFQTLQTETAAVVRAEELSETWMPHPAQPFLHIGHDFISASRQNVHGKPVSATCEHAVARFKMDVISPMEGFLAMGCDICAKMPFVG